MYLVSSVCIYSAESSQDQEEVHPTFDCPCTSTGSLHPIRKHLCFFPTPLAWSKVHHSRLQQTKCWFLYWSHVSFTRVLQSARRKELVRKRAHNLCKFPQRATENQPALTASIFCCSHWLVLNWFPARGLQSGVSVPETRTVFPTGPTEFLIDGWARCSWLNSLLYMSGLML